MRSCAVKDMSLPYGSASAGVPVRLIMSINLGGEHGHAS
jgi:hypothetical protein